MMAFRTLEGIIEGLKVELKPPAGYEKKRIIPGGDCPLEKFFTSEQVRRKIAFYEELNRRRVQIPKAGKVIELELALHGWEETTTVRVYMRETVMKIAAELFWSNYTLSVQNVNRQKEDGGIDKEHGYVLLRVKAMEPEIVALFEYIKPGASYYVYDGEECKYVPGKTEESEFIITKIDDPGQPSSYWRRSQSFISRVVIYVIRYFAEKG
ncbi:MAG: hypothetical protein ACUVWJ_07640 [Spirochaetota bacterium]